MKMKKNYLNTYGTEALAQAFFYLGEGKCVLLPRENVRLIRDVKVWLNAFGVKFEEVGFSEYGVGINLIEE